MERSATVACVTLLSLAGCVGSSAPSSQRTTPPTAQDPQHVGVEAAEGAVEEARLVPASDPERTQRAREIYLGGVRLLSSTPPQVEPAIREFQQALSVDPRFYRAHFKLGICYYHEGHYELEINEYKKCLAINPAYVPAWLNLGHAHLAKDELEQARRAYQEVLDREPNHAVALYNKALVELDLNNGEESLRLFRAFVQIDGSGEMGQRAKQYIQELEFRAKGGQGG